MMAMVKEYNEDVDFEDFIRLRILELKEKLGKAKHHRTRQSIIDSIRHNEWILLEMGGTLSDVEH